MAESKLDDCICSFADLLGGAKGQVISLIDTLISLLQALKATLLLFINIEDTLRLKVSEISLAAIQEQIKVVEAPFNMILGYTRMLADCDPVASFAKTLKDVRDDILKESLDLQYEIEQYVLGLEDKQNVILLIDYKMRMLEYA